MEKLFDIFEKASEELYLVGGYVRDKLLGKESEDIDLATSARPEKIIEILHSVGLKAIPIGIEFGTIQTIINDKKVEITTYRCKESYKKGDRKPSVVFGKSIEEDLARRDFTINSIAMDRFENTIDPFQGEISLLLKLITTPIDPVQSFTDDPLRMLRACRFRARFDSDIDNLMFKAMMKLARIVNEVSMERIFEEVTKILMTEKPSRGLTLMVETGLMKEIFPEIQTVVDFKQDQGKWHSKKVWPHTLQVIDSSPPIEEVRWAALFHDVAKPQTYEETETGIHFYHHDYIGSKIWDKVSRRLKTSKEFRDNVYQLIFEHLQPSLLITSEASNKALRRLIRRVPNLDNLFHLALADITSHNINISLIRKEECKELKARIHRLMEEDNIPKLKLPKGTGLVVAESLGIEPGPELGKVMKKLEQMLIDGDINVEADFGMIVKEM